MTNNQGPMARGRKKALNRHNNRSSGKTDYACLNGEQGAISGKAGLKKTMANFDPFHYST